MINLEFTIGTVIRLLREQKGLEQKDFGVHKVSQSRIENGVIRNPKPQTLEKIAKSLSVSVDELHEYVDRLNSISKMEPVDSDRLCLHRMLDDLLNADRPWSDIKGSIEGLHTGLVQSRLNKPHIN